MNKAAKMEQSRYKPKGFQLQSTSAWGDGSEGSWLPPLEAAVATSLTEEQFLWSSLCQYKAGNKKLYFSTKPCLCQLCNAETLMGPT